MKVVETFVSINGEGVKAGELAVFVRFAGCNLNCSYCDTAWANEQDVAYQEMSPTQVYNYIKSTHIRNVTLTGGEPLLQSDISDLLEMLIQDDDLSVEVETNGAVDISKLPADGVSYTMDYKLPLSGMEEFMLTDNFMYLMKDDTVKFVVGSRDDLNRSLEIIYSYHLTDKCFVYYSPIYGNIEPEEIVEFMKEHELNNVRLQLQMHKVIWEPDQRGV